MSAWTSDELDRIGGADELEVAPTGADGSPLRPTPVWVVRIGDELYLRSWRGDDGHWYRAAAAQGRGRISAGGVTKNVSFAAASDEVTNEAVDAGYREKYARYPSYVEPMVAQQARATTLRLIPREETR